MKSLFTTAALTLLSFSVFAADPTPKTAPVQDPDIKGAIQFENKPAVPAEELGLEKEEEKKSEKKEETQKSGSHHVGVHGALGLPHPLNYGLTYVHPSQTFSAQISTGSYSQTVDAIDFKLDNTEIGLRWHPWASSFFVGALFGQQKVNAKKTESITLYGDVTAVGEVKSNYITPHVGWMWGLHNAGFFFSFEVGYQSPFDVKIDLSSDAPALAQQTPDYQRLERQVRDDAEKYGKMGLPYVALLKLGWLF